MTKGKNRCRDQKSEEKQTQEARVGLLGRLQRAPCPFREVPANALGRHDKPKVMGPQNNKT